MTSIKQVSYINSIGQRPQLEDSIYPPPGEATNEDRLFMVCDGVGGESMGEEASRIACEEFASYFRKNPPVKNRLSKEYIKGAQQVVLKKMAGYADEYPEAEKMSTTLTLAYLGENDISIAWCGDSRIYHLRGGKVIWRSTDHSLVANLVKHGEITEEEASKHPQRNVITRSLSASGKPSEIDIYHINDLYDGDYIMLCTDGILEQIDDDILKGILQNENEDKIPLFMTCCQGKTRDNFSLYLLKLSVSGKPALKKPINFLIPLLLSLVFFALFALLFKKDIYHWINGAKTTNKPKIEQEEARKLNLSQSEKQNSAEVQTTSRSTNQDTLEQLKIAKDSDEKKRVPPKVNSDTLKEKKGVTNKVAGAEKKTQKGKVKKVDLTNVTDSNSPASPNKKLVDTAKNH